MKIESEELRKCSSRSVTVTSTFFCRSSSELSSEPSSESSSPFAFAFALAFELKEPLSLSLSLSLFLSFSLSFAVLVLKPNRACSIQSLCNAITSMLWWGAKERVKKRVLRKRRISRQSQRRQKKINSILFHLTCCALCTLCASMGQYSTAQYSTAQHSTAQQSMVRNLSSYKMMMIMIKN